MPLPNDDEPQRSGEKLEEEEPQDGGKTPNTATYQNSQTLKKKWTGGDSNSEADSANHASAEAEEREPSRRNLGAMRPRAPSRSPQKPATSR